MYSSTNFILTYKYIGAAMMGLELKLTFSYFSVQISFHDHKKICNYKTTLIKHNTQKTDKTF